MLPGMIGGYLLGSDAEAISFEPDGVAYGHVGATHAVNLDDSANAHAGSLGYALCGRPVRIWPAQVFDPGSRGAHDRCVALIEAAGRSGVRSADQ